MGKFIVELYNNGDRSWFHILPFDYLELLDSGNMLQNLTIAQKRAGITCDDIPVPYNGSLWCIVEAKNIPECIRKFFDKVYEVYPSKKGEKP